MKQCLANLLDYDIVNQEDYRSGGCIGTVRISPKHQVVIPKEIRKLLRIGPGEKVCVLQYGNRIEYIPERDIKSRRWFVKGIDTMMKREKDRV